MGQRDTLGAISAGLLFTWILALGLTVESAVENAHFEHGHYHSVLFDLELTTGRILLPALFVALVLAAIAQKIEQHSGRGLVFLRTFCGAGAGVTFLLLRGYAVNKYRFAGNWSETQREIGGLMVPEALFLEEVWLANLVILFWALLIWGCVRLLLGLVPRRISVAYWARLKSLPLVVSLAVLLAIAHGWASYLRPSHATHPSVILISLDTLRADHIGAYGYERDTSPELDRLAEESFLFEWAISQAPITSLSHMSMFTSLYPTAHGLAKTAQLPAWRITLAEYLREAGYRTAAVTGGGLVRAWYGFAQGFERYRDPRLPGLSANSETALEWLDAGLSETPFFLFLHTYDIHSPYDPPAAYRDMFAAPGHSDELSSSTQQLEALRLEVRSGGRAEHGLTSAGIAHLKARYDEGIRSTDRTLGEFVEALRSRGILEHTWLIITSDHGEEFTEHGSVLHEKLYHTVTHVPLIIRPPGPVRAGRRIEEVVELIDLMPTLLELIGIERGDDFQGQSLTPLFEGSPVAWKNVAYSEYRKLRSITGPDLHVMLELRADAVEAYDYKLDPLERVPLEMTGDERVESMRARLLEWNREQTRSAGNGVNKPTAAVPDAETLEQLRALGYVE